MSMNTEKKFRKDGFENRIYQIELIEKIKSQNAILFLPTGSGKTFIALELIKHMQEDLKKPISENGKRTIFLVNTVALVYQHYEFISQYCSLKINTVTGSSGTDLWTIDNWKEVEDKSQILIMTSQVYLNGLTHGYLFLKNANLIIFDECHHAVGNHPMKAVMTHVQQNSQEHQPKILGLSATLVNANTSPMEFHKDIEDLEKTFLAEIVTSKRVADVKKFSTNPEEIIESFPPYFLPGNLENIILLVGEYIQSLTPIKLIDSIDFSKNIGDKLMNDAGENRGKVLKNVLNDLLEHLKDYGLYVCYVGCTCYIIQLYRYMFEKSGDNRCINALLFLINATKLLKKMLSLEISRHGNLNEMTTVYHTSSKKIVFLFSLLNNLKNDDKCIIFVQKRMTAKILCKIIKVYFQSLKNCQSDVDFIIGQSLHPFKNSREGDFTDRCHKQIISKFKNGQVNVLVASNVLEEGIDLPDCNLIIMLDQLKTFRAYVQSKGRARSKNSRYYLLSDEKIEEFQQKLKDFKRLEVELNNLIHLKNIDDELDNKIENVNSEEMYVTNAGAKLNKTEAISTIEMYCASLPHDMFTTLTPYWWEHRSDNSTKVVCKLQLPINSVIKNLIVGPTCDNSREAKREVAFKAVKMLHEMGALNDNLIPCEIPPQIDEKYYFPNWKEEVSELTDGTKKMIRKTSLKIPKYLLDCQPVPNTTSYLHVINIKTEYPKPEIHRKLICHKLLSASYELGIVTKNRLPMIADFPIFSDLGQVSITIDTNYKTYEFNDKQIIEMSKFHKILFLKALQIVKSCLLFNTEDGNNGYFVVPLRPESEGKEIAWNIINESSEINEFFPPSETERKQSKIDEKDYLYKVVIPWYRTDSKNKLKYYIVTKIRKDITLNTKIENRALTYAEYFKSKFNLEAFHVLQPLLEVRPITHCLSSLHPRHNSSKKSVNESRPVYLVPEFCLLERFPAMYWYKATLLPGVLHRMYHLLLAEELREKIAEESGIGLLHLKKDSRDVIIFPKNEQITESALTPKDYNMTTTNLNRKRYLHRIMKFDELNQFSKKDIPKNIEHLSDPSIDDIKHYVSYFRQRQITTGETEMLCHSKPYVITFKKPPALQTLNLYESYEGPRQHEILEAITPLCCNEIFNMERLETLGDSFLKFAASFTTYTKCLNANEGHLTLVKSRIVGNRNLFYCGDKLELGTYLKMIRFSAYDSWCPPGFVVPKKLRNCISEIEAALFHLKIPFVEQYSGSISKQTVLSMKNDVLEFIEKKADSHESKINETSALLFLNQQYVPDKTVADTIEALIGLYVKTGGMKPAFQLLKYFGILPHHDYENTMGCKLPSPKFPNSKEQIENLIPQYSEIEDLLLYDFKDKSYIVKAFSHPSYVKNTMTDCYQTLEFIGDAVLDFLITSYIYEYCGNLPPGKLTDLRASLVNNVTFGALTVRLGLHKFLLNSSKKLLDSMNSFIAYQEEHDYRIHGNEMTILLSEDDVTTAEEVEVPKALGDIFESLAGAIFLDSGQNLKEVWRIYYNIMKDEIAEFSKNIPINPIRALYEQKGLKFQFLKPIFDCEENEMLKKYTANKMMTVPLRLFYKKKEYFFRGRGRKIDSCKRAAAKLALKFIGHFNFVI